MVRVLMVITYARGVLRTIKSDNGSEFISKVMAQVRPEACAGPLPYPHLLRSFVENKGASM